jgi:predicted dehydrogenase
VPQSSTRRTFLTAASLTAASYSRVLGANERVRIGQLGCGARGDGHVRMARASKDDMNVEMAAVCDIWVKNREKAAANIEKIWGRKPQMFRYSEQMLAMKDLDAVMIATGDFQHAKLLIETVKAGKDCYCEKPMANVFEEARQARAAVLGSKQIVQMGSQWVSDPYQLAVRDIIRSGQLGTISRIEQVWNKNEERWRIAEDPDIKNVRIEDTDWERWLLGKPYRPFDPKIYFEFRLYKDFSSGLIDQWMSHGSGLVHFYMDEDIPENVVANGGIFVWKDGRETADTITAAATYRKGFSHVFQAQFGNSYGSHSAIMGTNGTLWSEGGEGSQKWILTSEGGQVTDARKPRPGHRPVSGTRPVTVAGAPPATDGPSDDSKWHFDNWITCMRDRKQPNGDIHTGFKHSVAIIMAARAYWEGKKMYWDPKREQILDRQPV